MTEKSDVYEFTFPSLIREKVRFFDLLGIPTLSIVSIVLLWNLLTAERMRSSELHFTVVILSMGLPAYFVFRWWILRSKLFSPPMNVKVTEDKLVWERGNYRGEYSLRNLKEVSFSLSDGEFLLTATHREPVNGRDQWSFFFTSFFTLGSGDKFREFYSKTYPEFKMVLEERVRHLNPGVKIEVKDKRKKFRG